MAMSPALVRALVVGSPLRAMMALHSLTPLCTPGFVLAGRDLPALRPAFIINCNGVLSCHDCDSEVKPY